MPRKNLILRNIAGGTAAGGNPPRFVLRIIGGKWRGRKIRFPPIAAIRPTPDRVRETVFNWLQSAVPGSRCLDLYAGSGALIGVAVMLAGVPVLLLVRASGARTVERPESG